MCKGHFAEALFVVSRLDSKGARECESGRSRQGLSKDPYSNAANIGFDTAENEPLKVCQKFKISQKLEKS